MHTPDVARMGGPRAGRARMPHVPLSLGPGLTQQYGRKPASQRNLLSEAPQGCETSPLAGPRTIKVGKKSYTGAVDAHHPRRPCLPSRLPYKAHFESSWLKTYTTNCAGPAYSCHSAAPLPGRTTLTPSIYTLTCAFGGQWTHRKQRRPLLGAGQGHSRV